MSGTGATIGLGSMLSIGDKATPSILTEISEVIEISLPTPETEEVEATHFQSPEGAREFIGGLVDNGEVMYGINFIAGSPTDLLIAEAQKSRTIRPVEVIIPTTIGDKKQKFAFSGFVKRYERNIPLGDRLTAQVTLRVSGNVTQTAVAAPGGGA